MPLTNTGTKLEQAIDQVERAEQALDRNRGKLMEQDYRDILERAIGRLLLIEEGAPDVR